jgi:serine/threonine protein kinase
MPYVIRCPHCTKSMQVPDNAAGKHVQCPSCKQAFAVPALVAAAAAPTQPDVAAGNGSRAAAAAPSKPATPTKCPSCGSTLLEGAVACMDCGFMLQADGPAAEPEGPPNLCANPACGVANPPGERNCQRCGNPLPVAGGTLLRGRYRLEAEILKALDAVPIVPKCFDFIHQGQAAHLVMEFIKGKDLLDILEANGNKPFPIPLAIGWAKSICDVLDTMHTQSPPIIHRDLKPDNIMLLEDQKSIKMIDFGTARDLGRTAKERAAGKTRVYTEGYAPPEQIVGKPEARSDLFALSATLYHLVTGKAPEGFYTAKELETQLADPNSQLPSAYRWFFELIRINLSEDVNDRYFTAREIKRDLDAQKVTKEVTCTKCQTLNKVRTPFCTKCAEPLTDPASPCTMCGKYNRLGSRFCIYCGNRLR